MRQEDVLGDHEPEHRVTEELEALVRLGAGVLGAPRPVREGALQQSRVVERVPEPIDQRRVGVGGDQLSSRPCT
jgi:hypothetical protein